MAAANPTLRIVVSTETDRELVTVARNATNEVQAMEVGPTGVATFGSLAFATLNGTTAFHGDITPTSVQTLIESLDAGKLPTEGAYAVVEHEPRTDNLPTPQDGPHAVGHRRALGRCGWTDPTVPPSDRISDRPGEVRRVASETELLGRGRGDAATDEPVYSGWERTRNTDGDPVVVINGNEADPVAAMDRTLLAGATSEIMDTALAVADAVNATEVVAFVSEGDSLVHRRVEAAAQTMAEDRYIDLVVGPDEFVAGEETMALEAMEGADRLEARLQPPGPFEHGLYGRPTVIHTPRTLAQIRAAVQDDVDSEAADPGTRVLTVGGDVETPVTVELPTDQPLRAALGAVGNPDFKMACVGGRFGGLTKSLDVPASAGALASAGLGTNGVVELFDSSRCAVATAGHRARFAREKNCGRCVPCREGATQLHELMRDVYTGRYADAKLRELGRVMHETSVCSFGETAARPVLTAMAEFESEFRAHADGRCPAGACEVGS